MSWSLFPASTCDSVGANRCWEIPARAALKCCNDFSAVRLLRGAGGAVAAHSCRRLLVSLLHAASPRTNLDVTADYSYLDPHVSCVKTSHPAAQLDVKPEQRSVRQSMMSGPHHGDRAHIHTTFGTPRKFIRAFSSRSGWLGASRRRLSRSTSAPPPCRRNNFLSRLHGDQILLRSSAPNGRGPSGLTAPPNAAQCDTRHMTTGHTGQRGGSS